MPKTSLSVSEWASAGFQNFANEEFVSAPNTQIVNRALVSNSLKPVMGIERLKFNSIAALNKEFGPTGQTVFEVDSKDARVRFVGAGWTSLPGQTFPDYGGGAVTLASGDFVEVTFFGTGLNMLTNALGSRDFRVTVDGGSESANIVPASVSAALNARSYAGNVILVAASGLSPALHTVKIRNAAANGMLFNGIEIVNDRTNIMVNPGSSFAGTKKQSLTSALTSIYNSSITGVRGGRVVKYLLDGTLGESVQMVDASQANLGSADHANEEVIRRINFREFGANRGDDFSTLSSISDRAFTLDDGTTILVGNDVQVTTVGGVETLDLNGAAGVTFVVLTFVGTGLDVKTQDIAGATALPVSVNGASIGSYTAPLSNGVQKIVSGLPYGTHTVRFDRSGASQMNIVDFIIYGPKKPSIPSGAVELADFNVLADFSAAPLSGTAITDHMKIATGVVYKSAGREHAYVGTHSYNGPSAPFISTKNGFVDIMSVASSYYQNTFFGTGAVIEILADNVATTSITIQIDGVANASGVPVNAINNGSGNYTISINAATGPAWIYFTGLTLGAHTIKVIYNSGALLNIPGMQIITPIHINNTKVGSLSLKDSRNTKPTPIAVNSVDLSKAKAWLVYDQVNARILSSYNISSVVSASTGQFYLYYVKPFKSGQGVAAGAAVEDTGTASISPNGSASPKNSSMWVVTRNNAGTLTSFSYVSLVFFGELEDES